MLKTKVLKVLDFALIPVARLAGALHIEWLRHICWDFWTWSMLRQDADITPEEHELNAVYASEHRK